MQVFGRLWFRLARSRPDFSPPPPLATSSGVWCSPACRYPSLTGSGEFRILNEDGSLAANGWDDPQRAKLWRYHQHYFDDLNAQGASDRCNWHKPLIEDWIASNPPGRGSGWEPYPTSLRIVNWVKWALAGNVLSELANASLAVQVRWLRRRLEWHLLGNHLFANAKALVFAGLYFRGTEAAGWFSTGAAILERELPIQIHSDGGHFELSPMYHALALEDVLDLVNVLRAYGPMLNDTGCRLLAGCESCVPEMRAWLLAMSHADGAISFFNDSAFAVAPDNGELDQYAKRLGFGEVEKAADEIWFGASGYARLKRGRALLIADMAKVGPDYLPGHGHADTLSFEFSLGDQRVIVNSGTSIYGTGPERQRQRGTAAHNTVVVAGQDSSEVWAGFRVGRRARRIDPRAFAEGDSFVAEAGHDGYRHLERNLRHHRRWTLAAGELIVEDTISNPRFAAEARYHLHPDVEVQEEEDGRGTLLLPGGAKVYWRSAGNEVRVEKTTWHPEFGLSLPNKCICLTLRRGRALFRLSWS